MADVLTGLTEVDVTIEEIVSMQIQEVLTAAAIVPPTILDYTSQVGPGMDAVQIPKFGHFTVVDKVENVALEFQGNAFTADKLQLNEHNAVPFLIEDIAELQAKVNVTQAYIDQAGKDMAADMDLQLITALAASPSAAAPDHIVAYDNAPTNTLSKGDFTTARKLLNTQNVPMSERVALVSPLHERELLQIAEFVRVDESGGSQALRNGQIGKLFGFDVLMSAQVPDASTLFYHKTTHVYARQQELKVEQQRKIEHLGTAWVVSHLWGGKALDGGKRIVKVNATGA